MTSRLSHVIAACAVVTALSGCRRSVSADEYLRRAEEFSKNSKPQEALVELRLAAQVAPERGDVHSKLADGYVAAGDVANGIKEYIRAGDLLPNDDTAQVKAASALLVAGRSEEARTRAEAVLARNPKNVDAMVARGNAMVGLKDLAGAVEQLEEALRLEPAQTGVYTNLGAVQFARGNRAEAEQAFRQAITADPKSTNAHLALANFLFADGRRDEAEATLKDALALNQHDLLTNRALAMFAIASGRPAEAEPYLQNIAQDNQPPENRLMLADYYVSMKRYSDASRIYNALTPQEKYFATAKIRLAGLELLQNNPARAGEFINEALVKEPRNPAALVARARLLLVQNKRAEAVASLTDAIKVIPQSAEAHFTLGQAYLAQSDLDAAAKSFQQVLTLNPRALAAQVALARVELARQQPENATQLLRQALAAQPQNVEARMLLVRSLLASGKSPDADVELKALTDLHAQSSAVYALTGSVKLSHKDVKGAQDAFEQALRINAKDLDALWGAITVSLIEKRPDEARKRIDAALADKQDLRPALQLTAARTYGALADSAAAERALRRAIELDPSTIDAYGMLGRLYAGQGKLDEARHEFENIVRQQPRNVSAHTLVGMLHEAQKKPADAETAYKRALDVDPHAAVAANNLAWIYADSNRNLDVALELAKTATSGLPDNPQANDTLGYVYFKKQMYEPAARAFEQSLAKDPSAPDTQFHLGMTYVRTGQFDRAKKHLEEALKLKADFPGASEARQALHDIG